MGRILALCSQEDGGSWLSFEGSWKLGIEDSKIRKMLKKEHLFVIDLDELCYCTRKINRNCLLMIFG